MFEDHPRIRGTNFFTFALLIVRMGSSPHTRDKYKYYDVEKIRFRIIPAYAGQIVELWERGMRPRIIPAYAGQIKLSKANIFRHEDHPRIRGTNKVTSPTANSKKGSSPHTRDKFFMIF